MKCPYCQEELEQGFIQSGHNILWTKKKHIISTHSQGKDDFTVANLPIQIQSSTDRIDKSFRITHEQLVDLSVKYPSKIAILPLGNRATCDLGQLLHFTASGLIQGCPALPATKDQTISDVNWEELVRDFEKISNNCKFCPAWERIENHAEISKFLYGLSRE